jgi:hypothetical protein
MTAAIIDRFIEVPLVKNSNIKESIAIPGSLQVLKDKEKTSKWHRCFRFLTPKDGDKRIVWDSRDMDQIEDAKAMFDECVVKGLVPYRVGMDGKATAEVMDEFDGCAEEIIFLPIAQVAGG